MLVKLGPDKVGEYWEHIKVALEASIPERYRSEEATTKALEAALRGALTCFAIIGQSEGELEVVGMMFTTVTEDGVTGARSLLIYGLYGYSNLEDDLWLECLPQVQQFAKAQGCSSITGFTENPRIVDVVTRLFKGNASSILIEVPCKIGENIPISAKVDRLTRLSAKGGIRNG